MPLIVTVNAPVVPPLVACQPGDGTLVDVKRIVQAVMSPSPPHGCVASPNVMAVIVPLRVPPTTLPEDAEVQMIVSTPNAVVVVRATPVEVPAMEPVEPK
jgi:hypothetical protein